MSRAALTTTPYSAEPFGVMRRLSDEMDRIFQGFALPRTFGGRPDTAWTPALESFTRDGQFVVRAELAGLTEKDVNVEVAGDLLTITGERKEEKTVKDAGAFTTERSYGHFMRGVRLPEGVRADQARATFTRGVLEVSMPMATPRASEARKVEVTPA